MQRQAGHARRRRAVAHSPRTGQDVVASAQSFRSYASFQSCSLRNRLDYILLSEELAGTVTGGGIFRKGLWGDPGNVNPPQAWEIYPEITASVHAASDHAAIWVDLDL